MEVKMEFELITAEVRMIEAALRRRAVRVNGVSIPIHKRLADEMTVIGLYWFTAHEAGIICVALTDYAQNLLAARGQIQKAGHAQHLADEFLTRLFMQLPLENFRELQLSS